MNYDFYRKKYGFEGIELEKLNPRIINCLLHHNITSIDKLTACTLKELSRIPNMGKGSLKIIEDYLEDNGLCLKNEYSIHKSPTTLRIEFAKAALTGLLANPKLICAKGKTIEDYALEHADALLERLKNDN